MAVPTPSGGAKQTHPEGAKHPKTMLAEFVGQRPGLGGIRALVFEVLEDAGPQAPYVNRRGSHATSLARDTVQFVGIRDVESHNPGGTTAPTHLLSHLLAQAPQRYLVGVRLGTRLLSSCRAKNQKLASTAAAQQALDVLESEEAQG